MSNRRFGVEHSKWFSFGVVLFDVTLFLMPKVSS